MPNTDTSSSQQPTVDPQQLDGGQLKTVLLDLISAAELPEVEAVLDELWAIENLFIRRPPETGLVMITVRDPFDTDFFLGEALITSAEVVCDGVAGLGTILGEEPKRALLLAATEALEQRGRKISLSAVVDLIARLKRRETLRRQRDSKMAAATNVCFESMKKEHVDFGSLGG